MNDGKMRMELNEEEFQHLITSPIHNSNQNNALPMKRDLPKTLTNMRKSGTLEAPRTYVQKGRLPMGQAVRTTKLFLDLRRREERGTNPGKRAYLEATAEVLTQARAFYLDFFLVHAEKLAERVSYYSEKHRERRERAISPHELLTWAESCTVATPEHPHPWPGWNFSERFPQMPVVYRRAALKVAIGKARSYLSHRAHWRASGKRKGEPGLPGASNHPTLYRGTILLEAGKENQHSRFLRLKVYTGIEWRWANYPIKNSRYFQQRRDDLGWENHSPKLVLRKTTAEVHFSQTKGISAKKIKESKLDPNLVMVAERALTTLTSLRNKNYVVLRFLRYTSL